MTILLTGGAGYIGSHMTVELIARGITPVIVDNLCNSDIATIDRIEKIIDQSTDAPNKNARPIFYNVDVRDTTALTTIMCDHKITSVVHFAALKSVGESVSNPVDYYANNIGGLTSVLSAMNTAHVTKYFIYSSSATVYAPRITNDATSLPPPFDETSPLGPINPYGQTKAMGEQMVRDWAISTPNAKPAILRYFNPVGAHPSGIIGEFSRGTPNNLMPYICQVAGKHRPALTIFGDDYDTPDGTAIRDYIHVNDVVDAHIRILHHLKNGGDPCTYNIGTGTGYSVRDMVNTFMSVNQVDVPTIIGPRRTGDAACVVADISKIARELEWRATHSLVDMCRDAWKFEQNRS